MRTLNRDFRIVILSLCGAFGFTLLAESLAAETVVIAYCKATKNFGISSNESEALAAEDSLRHCNATGGDRVVGCCTIVGVADSGCIALAVGPTREQGTETGNTMMEVISAAVEACPENGCVARTYRCIR